MYVPHLTICVIAQWPGLKHRSCSADHAASIKSCLLLTNRVTGRMCRRATLPVGSRGCRHHAARPPQPACAQIIPVQRRKSSEMGERGDEECEPQVTPNMAKNHAGTQPHLIVHLCLHTCTRRTQTPTRDPGDAKSETMHCKFTRVAVHATAASVVAVGWRRPNAQE